MKQYSIKDIAKLAGVSPSTVSFVINGREEEMRISKRLSDKVRDVITETGYVPNKTAVSLRTGRTMVLGLIVENISNSFFSNLAKTIEDRAYDEGYSVVYCSTENNDSKAIDLVKRLTNQVDGFIIAPTSGMQRALTHLQKIKKPFVFIDRFLPGYNVPYVMVDNYQGVKIGMECLINRGYSKVLFVTVDLQQIQMKYRLQAYIDVVKECNVFKEDLILSLPYSIDNNILTNAIKTVLLNIHTEIDAVFFATNYLGICGLQALKELEMNIPEDIGVICFDDNYIFKLHTPSISVVHQPINDIAQAAIKSLIDTILGNEIQPEMMFKNLPAEIILRKSL